MKRHTDFLNDLETMEKFPINGNKPYHVILGYFYGMYLSGLLIQAIAGIRDRQPVNIDGNNCLFLGIDDYIDDFQDVYGYEYALNHPTFYFSFGFDDKNQIIVSEKKAFEAAVFVAKKSIEIYPAKQDIFNNMIVQLQQNKQENA